MINYVIKIAGLLFFPFFCFAANSSVMPTTNVDQSKVIAVVEKAENFIQKNGIEKSIRAFRNSKNIVIGDYNGMFYVSPLHPELIGTNQWNYKDSSGAFVVQEEIQKAKAGGGWLQGRWRKNPQTRQYACRKIYILPIAPHYFIGSWYHYPSKKQKVCLS